MAENDDLDKAYIRFESLCMAERMSKLTEEERQELDSMSTLPPLTGFSPKREMLGSRICMFIK